MKVDVICKGLEKVSEGDDVTKGEVLEHLRGNAVFASGTVAGDVFKNVSYFIGVADEGVGILSSRLVMDLPG